MTKWLPLAPITDRPGSTQFLQYLAAQERAIAAAGTGGGGSASWGGITGTLSAQTDLQAALTLRVFNFASRAAFVTANTALPGLGLSDGQIVTAGGLEYRRLAASTAISGLSGWVPNDISTPQHFGAVGDNVADDRPAFVAMNTFGGDVFIPEPPATYNVSSAIDLDNVAVSVDPRAVWANLTDTGLITWTQEPGATTNVGAINTRRVNINRLADRVFIGAAADEWAGNSLSADAGSSWWANPANASAYLGVNAQTLVVGNHLPYGVVSLVRGSDTLTETPIGLASSVVNDGAGRNAWGGITELQHETGASQTIGWEIGAKHKGGAYTTLNAYNTGSGVFGFWMAGGGDNRQGGGATLPANSPMVVLKNTASGLTGGGWATGIVFKSDALDGVTGVAGANEAAPAISMGRAHTLDWGAPTNGAFDVGTYGARITSRVDDASEAVVQFFENDRIFWTDRTGATFADITNGGADYLGFRSSTGGGRLDAKGASTDIDVRLVPKGAGLVRFGTFTAAVNGPVTGYIEIKDAGGTTRRLGVVTGTPGSGGSGPSPALSWVI